MADRARRGTAVLIALLLITGCTAAPEIPTPVGPAGVPPDPRVAVRAVVEAINATAAGAVADQQEVLARAVDPARAAEQAACAPATITVRLDAVLDRLTPLPATGAAGATSAAPQHERYRLPVLLEVYTGAVRTGTDLAGLELIVIDGVAHTAPLCLR